MEMFLFCKCMVSTVMRDSLFLSSCEIPMLIILIFVMVLILILIFVVIFVVILL